MAAAYQQHEWLISDMNRILKSYWRDNLTVCLGLAGGFLPAALILSSGAQWGIIFVFLGSACGFSLMLKLRLDNMDIDRQIDAVLAQVQSICGGSVTFAFFRQNTGVCKQQHAPDLEYRGIPRSGSLQDELWLCR